MSADDPVDDEAQIFTEAEIFLIGGYLHGKWFGPMEEGFQENVANDIEQAITAVLQAKGNGEL